jgi:protein-S-isoprenylcysteine O-methyltransferase Ste14
VGITVFEWIFVAGIVISEVIRFPHRQRNKRDLRAGRLDSRIDTTEVVLSILAWAGSEIVPLAYVFSPWFDVADYRLPAWVGWIGVMLMAASVVVLWRAHRDLGLNWSPTLQLQPDHVLVTDGIYGVMRHPIYAAYLLGVIAQALLLNNWIAGPIGLVTFIPIYLTRVPREEAMMIETFGDTYRAYMRCVGRLLPRV